jgi:hypothetical protein
VRLRARIFIFGAFIADIDTTDKIMKSKEIFAMEYRMKIAGLDRDLPICPVNDKLYIAGFVIFGDPELTVACAKELLARAPKDD